MRAKLQAIVDGVEPDYGLGGFTERAILPMLEQAYREGEMEALRKVIRNTHEELRRMAEQTGGEE